MALKQNLTRYLIRFDDLCPTMSSERWEQFYSIIAKRGIRPILAVVPDNQDPQLKIQDPDPEFWNRMRSLEAMGATVAMHGYRHLCRSYGDSILGLHEETEFAGVSEDVQRQWIRSGLEIFRDHGLSPRLFVAPRHGFDHATLRALASEGLRCLSDGFSRRPFMRDGVVWIPQQLWEPVRKESGLWTICIHTNTASASLAEKLERFVWENAGQFTSFDRVLSENNLAELGWAERVAERMANLRVRLGSTNRAHGSQA